MASLQIVAGDTLPRLVVRVRDRMTNEIIDITGCTGKINYRVNGGAVQSRNMVGLDPPAEGRFAYQIQAADFARGIAEAQVEVTTSDMKKGTSKKIIIEVEEKLAPV